LAHRITDLLARAPRHQRARLAAAASSARRALGYSLGAGAECALAALASARQFDARSLDEIAALAEGRQARKNDAGELVPLVLIVLRRAGSG